MHVLYIHKAFPPQFAPLARGLAETYGWQNTFLSRVENQTVDGLNNIQYQLPGGEIESKEWDRAFQTQLQHSVGVAELLRRRPEIRPDLVVAHSGFGSSHLVPTVRDVPIINYCEYYTQPTQNDLLYREEWHHEPWYYQWRRTANAMALIDLQTCHAAYSPTQWQRSTFPQEYQPKIEVLFDGMDTTLFRPAPGKVPRKIGDHVIPEGVNIVTFISRGFELVRGFDVFMKVAKRIYQARPNTLFIVAGKDRVCYGTDVTLTGSTSFKEWVMKQDTYDESKFLFLNWLPGDQLVRMLHLSNLHLYFTTPFVPSWSLFNAMGCGTTVLASDVEPVREIVRHGENGLLGDFYDFDGLAGQAIEVLDDPAKYKPLGQKAAADMQENYSLDAMLPRYKSFFEKIAGLKK